MSPDEALYSSCAETLEAHIREIFGDRPIAVDSPSVVNDLIGGVKKARLYVIGGEPGCGKSTLCDQIKTSLASQGIVVVYISYELPASFLTAKSLSRLSSGSLKVNELPYANEDESSLANLKEAIERYREIAANFFVFDEPLEAVEICHRVGEIEKQTGKQVALICDYAQLIPPPKGECLDERLRISRAISELRKIANIYRIPVFAISSITRQTYKKTRARLDCLAGSQTLEYASDTVFFVSSDEASSDEGYQALHGNEQGVLITFSKIGSRVAGRPTLSLIPSSRCSRTAMNGSRSARMEIRLSDEERGEIIRRACEANLSVSDFLRKRALLDDGRPIIKNDPAALRRLHVNLKRAGGLLNQCARILNTRKDPIEIENELKTSVNAVEIAARDVSGFLADARKSV